MISTYEELAKELLYITEPEQKLKREILVGIIGDYDISGILSPDFKLRLIRLLESKEVKSGYDTRRDIGSDNG